MDIEKNKKGFLLGEFTLKIIVAVLCLSLLIYLLAGIYGMLTGKQLIKEAEATLESLIEKMNSIETEGSYMLLEPHSALSYSEKAAGSCKSGCLCLEAIRWRIMPNTDICKEIGNKITIIGDEIEFAPDKPVEILIKKEGDGYAISKG